MRKVIIDVDVGTDDYLAILVLLYGEKLGKLQIEAITCCAGNTAVDNVVRNVVRLLETIGRTSIPVYKGASQSLIPPKPVKQFHGDDGFGDLKHENEPDLTLVRETPAAIAIEKIVRKYPKEVEIICVAPLTNLALSLRLFNGLSNDIKALWIMGGNHTAVGNVTPSAEYNFYIDPESAFIVFDTLKCPIYLLPWEACLTPGITFEWRYNSLNQDHPALTLLTRAEKNVYKQDYEYEHWMPCDSFLAYVFLDLEKHSEKISMHHATIELRGDHTRGQIVLDHLKIQKPNVTVIERIDAEGFKKMLFEVFE